MKTRKWKVCCESVPTVDPETGKCQNGCKGESKPAVMHTLTPWTYEAEANGLTFSIWNGDISIAETQTEADAAFIVKAVNCHEEMLNLLKEIDNFFQSGPRRLSAHALRDDAMTFGDAVTKLIARAEGRQHENR